MADDNDKVTVLGHGWPEDHRDLHARRLAEFGGEAGLARHETLLAIHNSGLGTEMADLRSELKHMQRLLVERVEKKTGDWLTVDDVARLLGMTRKGVYCTLTRDPHHPLALAASRLGRKLRWSKTGIDELLRTRSPSLTSRRRTLLMRSRDTSPARSGR